LNLFDEDESYNLEVQERPTFHEMQTPAFENGVLPPTFSFDTPRTRGMQIAWCPRSTKEEMGKKNFKWMYNLVQLLQ